MTLKNEIENDPLSRGYSQMTDEQVAADLNSAYRSRLVRIPSSELLAWSAAAGRLARIKAGIDGGANDEIKSLCEAAYLLIVRDTTGLDLSRPDRMALVDHLVTLGYLTAEDKASVIAIGTESISRAEELGLGEVKPGHVALARGN